VSAAAVTFERARAPFGRRLLEVRANDALGAYQLVSVVDVEGPPPAPGQFVMLAAAERWGGGEEERPHLARALSFARFEDGVAQFLLEAVGPGTRRLCALQAGERCWVLGPLGRPFSAPAPGERALLVGGGVGVAPLVILADRLAACERGADTTVLVGFRDRARARGADLFAQAQLVTDDGSAGERGLVTELLERELGEGAPARVYACGPVAMLEGVRSLCEERGVPAQLALEAPMACGFGACFGCVVPARSGGYLRVCHDGPVIDAQLLDQVEAHAGAPA